MLVKFDLNFKIFFLISNNCHSHVAHALNLINYKKFSTYNMIHIWWMFLLHGKYVSTLHILKTYLGFIIFLLIILVVFKL